MPISRPMAARAAAAWSRPIELAPLPATCRVTETDQGPIRAKGQDPHRLIITMTSLSSAAS
jgi:hypothetical protein